MVADIATPLFDPKTAEHQMEIVPWGSGSGSNIEAMVRGATNYRVVAMLYDRLEYKGKRCKVPDIAKAADVPPIFVDSEAVRKHRKNGQVRADYYKRVVDALNDTSAKYGFHVDLIPLGGFMLLLGEPALSAYRDRIINVHPADLSILRANGKRMYTGDRAVLDVVKHRCPATKSTIHVVTPETDGGEILVQKAMGIEYPRAEIIDGWNESSWQAFANLVQDRQKRECDWPAYVAALQMIADGRFALGGAHALNRHVDRLRTVYLDGKPLPYEGFQVPNESGG